MNTDALINCIQDHLGDSNIITICCPNSTPNDLCQQEIARQQNLNSEWQ